jgi:hypothetical protein
MVLAAVLDVVVPDRSAVTGQPWLVVKHDDETLPGAHEVWGASWTTSTVKAAGAISVYLDPVLNDPAGPASLFQVTPSVLGGVFDGAYGTFLYSLLPLQPPAFLRAGQALSAATDWFGTAAHQFTSMDQSARASLSGAAAQVIADLFGQLGSVAASLHEQMSGPVSYASAIADTAGGAALRFLNSLWLAYSDWTRQPAYTPAGAIVQVLQAVGQPQPDSTYLINDPEHTAYGDLTTDQGWTTAEQRAKNQWLSLLTTGTDGFGGLDPLAHDALSSLIGAYDRAVNVLQAVTIAVPPAGPPPAVPPPAGGPGNPANPGPAPAPPPAAPPPASGPGDPVNLVLVPSPPPPPAPALAGGAGNPVALGPAPGLPPPAGGGDPDAPPAVFGSALTIRDASVVPRSLSGPPAGALAAGPVIGSQGTIALLAVAAEGPAAAAGGPAAAAADPVVLSGAIGALGDKAAGALGDEAPPPAPPEADLTGDVLVLGAIGRERAVSSERTRSGGASQAGAAVRLAPVAGVALGRGPDGAVLAQAKVPALLAKPPSIRSSAILISTLEVGQSGEGYTGGSGAVMLPTAALGNGFGGLGGPPGEQQRLSHLPEDGESWGTNPQEPDTAVGVPRAGRRYQPPPGEEDGEAEIHHDPGAIGRRNQPG